MAPLSSRAPAASASPSATPQPSLDATCHPSPSLVPRVRYDDPLHSASAGAIAQRKREQEERKAMKRMGRVEREQNSDAARIR